MFLLIIIYNLLIRYCDVVGNLDNNPHKINFFINYNMKNQLIPIQ